MKKNVEIVDGFTSSYFEAWCLLNFINSLDSFWVVFLENVFFCVSWFFMKHGNSNRDFPLNFLPSWIVVKWHHCNFQAKIGWRIFLYEQSTSIAKLYRERIKTFIKLSTTVDSGPWSISIWIFKARKHSSFREELKGKRSNRRTEEHHFKCKWIPTTYQALQRDAREAEMGMRR